MVSLSLSLWEQHVEKWKDCKRCELHETRRNVVLARGVLPCDLLFTGEGPGFSEDSLGVPFIGPAGHLLDSIIKRAIPTSVRICLTNLICCIPIDQYSREKTDKPPDFAVEACAPRLIELVSIANPKVIITVGRDPDEWLEIGFKHSIAVPASIPRVKIMHPAAILRAPMARKTLDIQRVVVTLADTVEKYLGITE